MHHTVLIILVLLTTSETLTASKCQCSQIKQQSDCSSQTGCVFVNQDSFKMCASTKFIPNCTYFSTNQYECDIISGCAWNKNQNCSNFTQCSDYLIKPGEKADLCYLKDSTCVPGSLESNGSRICTTGAVDCSLITDSTICNMVYPGQSSYCMWSLQSNSCIIQDYSKCSTITDYKFCNLKNCIFQNSTCTVPICADFKEAQKCTSVRDDEEGKFKICVWKDNQCKDADGTSHLNMQNCFTNSNKTYQWNNESGTCDVCMTFDKDDHIPLTIGLSVSLPTALLIIIGIIVFVSWKRQKEKQPNPYEITRVSRLYKDIRMEENIKERECRFCTNEFKGDDEISVLGCKHMFHNICLEEYKKKNNTCPTCNSVINQE